jgi:hypothetical protein
MPTETEQVETTTTSTETVEKPEDLKAELARVQAALKEANSEAAGRRKKLEAFEAAEAKRKESEMSELQKAQAKLAEYETRIKAHDREKVQAEIAAKTGLPAAFASRLKGETPEELEADAKSLLEALPKPAGKQTPTLNPTNPAGASGGLTQEQKDVQTNAWLKGREQPFNGAGGGYTLPPKD